MSTCQKIPCVNHIDCVVYLPAIYVHHLIGRAVGALHLESGSAGFYFAKTPEITLIVTPSISSYHYATAYHPRTHCLLSRHENFQSSDGMSDTQKGD